MTKEECKRKRAVTSCRKCYRNKECYLGQSCEPTNDEGCLRLGYAIIGGCCEEYERAYRKGRKNTCAYYTRWFHGSRPTILSAEKYDGVAIIEGLEAFCYKKYGSLEEIYQRKKTKINKQIAELNIKVKDKSLSPKSRGVIKGQISKLRGELAL